MHYIFGPVTSRRFGKSLGINIIPFKICTYDCIYCEVGKTTKKTAERKDYVNVDLLLEEFKQTYSLYQNNLDVITITGQGEPTLNSQLGDIITKIQSLADKPILVLTNGSLLYEEEVRSALSKAHMVCTSLDAVHPDIFYKVNNPFFNINLDNLINGLIEFSYFYTGKLYIEVLLVKGVNDYINHIDEIIKVIRKCKYYSVQINTVYRPPAYPFAEPIDELKLFELELYMNDMGVKVDKSSKTYKKIRTTQDFLRDYILNTSAIRPLCIDEITKIFNSSRFEIDKIIEKLIMNCELSVITHGNKKYYIKSTNRRI
jgi:wyosine [tRNA(Phe)-imidazoG37] synthetase (radical SAM superfamily)